MINVETFYKLSKCRKSSALTIIPLSSYYVNSLRCRCLNDNDVVRIIYDLAGQSGKIPNDLDVSLSPNVPIEVSNLLAQIQRERPLAPQFADDKTAIEFIRSRYCQFGGELDDYAGYLASILNDSMKNMPKPKPGVPPVPPVEPPKTE